MANGNPFYVQPGNNFGPALSGLANTLSQVGERKRARDEKQAATLKFETVKQGAITAYESNDPDQIAEFSLANPEMAEAMYHASEFRNKLTADSYKDSLFSVYQDPSPENIQRNLEARQQLLQEQGVPPENSQETDTFLERFQEDPEGMKEEIAAELAFRYPTEWKSFKSIVPAAAPLKDRFKVVGDRLVDLSSEGGPSVVVGGKKGKGTLIDKGLVKVGESLVDVSDPERPRQVYSQKDKRSVTPHSDLAKLRSDLDNGLISGEDYVIQKEKIVNPRAKNVVELTAAALKGDKEAKNILDAMNNTAVEVAGDKAEAVAEGKIKGLFSNIDVDGTVKAILEGKETLDNVKNTFGVPIQEVVRAGVLARNPDFNFVQPVAISKSLTSSLVQQEKNLGAMGSFVKNINGQVDKLEKMGNEIIKRAGIRALDIPIRSFNTRFIGSGNEKVFEAYLKEISAEVAKLSQGSSGSVAQLPESARQEWESIHDTNLSMRELIKVLKATREMANIRQESVRDEISNTVDKLGNINPEASAAAPEPQAAPLYKEGDRATGPGPEKQRLVFKRGNWEAYNGL